MIRPAAAGDEPEGTTWQWAATGIITGSVIGVAIATLVVNIWRLL